MLGPPEMLLVPEIDFLKSSGVGLVFVVGVLKSKLGERARFNLFSLSALSSSACLSLVLLDLSPEP